MSPPHTLSKSAAGKLIKIEEPPYHAMSWIQTEPRCVSSQCNEWRLLEESSSKHCIKTAAENVFPLSNEQIKQLKWSPPHAPCNSIDSTWKSVLPIQWIKKHLDVTSPHALNNDSNWNSHLTMHWIKSVSPLNAMNKRHQLKESSLNVINKGSSWKNLLSMQWIKIAVWRVSSQREVEKLDDWPVPDFKECSNVNIALFTCNCNPHGKILQLSSW